MSKRFGRNQRRRARETQAQLEEHIKKLDASLASASMRVTRLLKDLGLASGRLALRETQIDALQDALGPTMLLPPTEIIMDTREFRELAERGLMVLPPPSGHFDEFPRYPIFPSAEEHQSDIAMTAYKAMTLDMIEGALELLEGHPLRREPHAYLKTRQGDIMYAVRIGALAELHRPEGINRIAHMLATEFIDTMKRKAPQGFPRQR